MSAKDKYLNGWQLYKGKYYFLKDGYVVKLGIDKSTLVYAPFVSSRCGFVRVFNYTMKDVEKGLKDGSVMLFRVVEVNYYEN